MRAAPTPIAEPLWAALRHASEPVSIAELADQLRLPAKAINTRICRWERAGFVRRAGFGRTRTKTLTLKVIMTETAGGLHVPPRVAPSGAIVPAKNGRQRIWSAIRVLKRFNRIEAEQASEQSRRNVEDYLNCLIRAGYLRKVRQANAMRGQLAEYQLLRNTGLKAPVVSHGSRNGVRFRELADPNDGSRHDIAPRSKPASAEGGVINHVR